MEENNNKRFSIKNLFKSKKNIVIMVLSFLLLCSMISYSNSDMYNYQIQIENLNKQITTLKDENASLESQISNLKEENAKVLDNKQQTEEDQTIATDEEKKVEPEVSSTPSSTPIPTPTLTPTPVPSSVTTSIPTPQPTSVSKSVSNSYVLNTNTKKFHYPSCSSVKQMKDSNKRFFDGTRDEVITQGYSPCKRCNP